MATENKTNEDLETSMICFSVGCALWIFIGVWLWYMGTDPKGWQGDQAGVLILAVMAALGSGLIIISIYERVVRFWELMHKDLETSATTVEVPTLIRLASFLWKSMLTVAVACLILDRFPFVHAFILNAVHRR
jgi:hypothetical protein